MLAAHLPIMFAGSGDQDEVTGRQQCAAKALIVPLQLHKPHFLGAAASDAIAC